MGNTNYFRIRSTKYGEIYDDSLNSIIRIYDEFNQTYISSIFSVNGEVLYGLIPNGIEIDIVHILENGYEHLPFYDTVRPKLLFRLNEKKMLVARKENTNMIIIRPIF
jgi:hypothetical protein